MSIADQLRGERGIAARGRLSLDREKAREKLRMFRLPDPHFYVLQFVRAASVAGATRVEFEIGARDVVCRFDRPLRGELLADLWGIAFENRVDEDSVAVHYLALGLGSAQALDPSLIEVSSGRSSLRLRGEEETYDADAPFVSGTTIRVVEKFRFGHVLEFFSSIAGELAEVKALRSRCAHAAMEVIINGKSIVVDLTKDRIFPVHFEGLTESGLVALDVTSIAGECAVLRDSVQVATQVIDNHGLAGMGVLESSRLGTDLSGLALVGSESVIDAVHDVLIPNYHVSLQGWLRSGNSDVADKLDALSSLITYTASLTEWGRSIAAATADLLDWLMNERLFENALEPPGAMLSIAEAQSPDGAIRFSCERFVGADLRGIQGVLLVEASHLGLGVDGLRWRMQREAVVRALQQASNHNVMIVTNWLKRRAEATRNRDLWMARPPRELPAGPFVETVTIDELRGDLFIPLEPTGAIAVAECGLSLYANDRLLRHTRNDEMFAVSIGGDATPRETHDDIVRGDRFDRLAVALCLRVLPLYRNFAAAMLAAGKAETARPRSIDTLVLGLWQGTLCEQFLETLGYLPSAVRDELASSELLEPLRWFSWAPAVAEIIEQLGPIAQLRSYELADGSFASLAALVERSDLLLLSPTGNWRSFLARTRDALGAEILSSIVIVDEVQGKILRRCCTSAPDAVLVVPNMLARQAFLNGPEYEDPVPLELIEDSCDVEHPGANIRVMLVRGGEIGVCEVQFVWRGRALSTRRLRGGLAAIRAVVRSDEVNPVDDCRDVEEDEVFASLIDAVEQAASSMLTRWWTKRLAGGDLGEGAVLRQFIEVAFSVAEESPDDEVIPVLDVDREVGWRPGFASLNALRRLAIADGQMIPFSRTRDPDPPTTGANRVVRLAPQMSTADLGRLLGGDVRLIDANVTGVHRADIFLRKPERPAEVRGGVVQWRGLIREVACHCAMDSDPLVGTGRQANRAEVLLHNRVLEKLDVEVPMGQFRTVLRGPDLRNGLRIEADPTYQFVAAGRVEVMDAIYQSAAATIREACRLFAVRGGATPDLVAIVPDLRRFLATCLRDEPAPPFDLRALLESTPLFQLLDGSWLSFRQLSTIARGDVLLYADGGDQADVLWLTSNEIAGIERALEGRYRLEAAAHRFEMAPLEPIAGSELLHNVGSSPARRGLQLPEDPLLADVIDILLEARGSRLDLFDDHFAQSFEWSSLPSGQLCRVTPEKVEIDEQHALIQRIRAQNDHGSRAFLASAVYSAINAYYDRITDHDELELQSRLVRSMRD